MMAAAERFLQLHQLCDRTSTPDRTLVFEDGNSKFSTHPPEKLGDLDLQGKTEK